MEACWGNLALHDNYNTRERQLKKLVFRPFEEQFLVILKCIRPLKHLLFIIFDLLPLTCSLVMLIQYKHTCALAMFEPRESKRLLQFLHFQHFQHFWAIYFFYLSISIFFLLCANWCHMEEILYFGFNVHAQKLSYSPKTTPGRH